MFGNKKKDTTAFTAGCGRCATEEEISALAKRFSEKPTSPIEDAYISGFLVALKFSNVPKNAEVYEWDAFDFEDNAYSWFLDEMVKEVIDHELHGLYDTLGKILGDDDGE